MIPLQEQAVSNKKRFVTKGLETMEHHLLSAIGNTPLVRLSNLFRSHKSIEVYGKLEMMNPGGSAKDRPALRMIQHAWDKGLIRPGSVVIESSSGNMAISLAYICRYMGLRFISVIDPRTAEQNIRIMKAFGAEVHYVSEPDEETGEFLSARLNRVRALLAEIPGSYWPNQYANEHNYMSHYDTTMREIAEHLPKVDYLFGGASTCGTLLGCSKYIHDHNMSTQIVAVDAEGSVLFGGNKGHRRFPGLGAGIVPPFALEPFADHVKSVSDWEMVVGCRMLVDQEAILVGPSSGGVVMALHNMLSELPEHAVCVLIIHDRGERYLDTVYSEDWVQQQFNTQPVR